MRFLGIVKKNNTPYFRAILPVQPVNFGCRQNRCMMKTLKILLYFLLLPLVALAQNSQPTEVPITLEHPYNTIYAHLYYLQEDSYQPERAARTLYTEQDSSQRERLAIQLKQIFDGKGLYVQVNQLPQDSNYIDSATQLNIYIPFPRDLPEVYLQKIDAQWYYSPETIQKIPELHKQVYPFGADVLLNLLPRYGQGRVLGLKIWQYVGLLILLTIGGLIHWLLNGLLFPLVGRITRYRLHPKLADRVLIRQITRTFSVLIVLHILRIFLPILQLPIRSSEFAMLTIRILTIFFVVWLLFKILDVIMVYAMRYTEKTESKLDEQLMPIIRRTLQAVLMVGGIVEAMRMLGVNVTTLIAGISIGGLALALAAQDMLKNLFGSLTIFLDKPFQIGDWINFSGVDGTVEEVGFRSTRVRTFSNSLVYVPNGKLADMIVDNYGLRVYRRFRTEITIAYGTPTPLIEKFVEGLRGIVDQHPDTRKDFYHIYLNALGSHSLNILFYIFFAVSDWPSELKARHQVLMAILDLAHELGVQFAFPTQTLHVETFPEKTGNSPLYNVHPDEMNQRLRHFFSKYEQGFAKNGRNP